MHKRALIFNLDEGNKLVSAEDLARVQQQSVVCVTSFEEAIKEIDSGKYYVPIVITEKFSEHAQKLLLTFQKKYPSLVGFPVIVCNDPEPKLQGMAYENGINQFWPSQGFAQQVDTWLSEKEQILKDEKTVEHRMLKMGVLLSRGKVTEAERVGKTLSDEVDVDFRVSFLFGLSAQMRGVLPEAKQFFERAKNLNTRFLPAIVSLANLNLQAGNPKEALDILNRLEMLNSSNPDRKALLAAASADAGDWEKAKKHLEEAATLEPNNSRVKEMQVRVAFSSGNVDGAIAMLDKCETTDEYFISKLNEQAISLSKTGNLKKALTLYEKAHTLAPLHFKYKISFNIALGYKRQNDNKKALEYLDLVEKERGEIPFEKAGKLREQIIAEGRGAK